MTQPPTYAQLAKRAAIVARRVQQAVAAAGLSQRDLAAQTGIPLATLNRRLNGSPFIITELMAVADVLGTQTSTLIGE